MMIRAAVVRLVTVAMIGALPACSDSETAADGASDAATDAAVVDAATDAPAADGTVHTGGDAAADTAKNPCCDGPSAKDAGADAPAADQAVRTDSAGRDAPAADRGVTPDGAPPRPDSIAVNDGPVAGDGGVFRPTATAPQIAAACTRILSCVGTPTTSTINDCINDLYAEGGGALVSYLPCLANGSAGCADIKSCSGVSYTAPNCSTFSSSCSGNNFDYCYPGVLHQVIDCQRFFGTGCMTFSSGTSACSTGTPCSGSGLFCKGDLLARCTGGNEVLTANCSLSGLSCRSGACAGPDEPCSGAAARCESSDTIAYCIGRHRLRVSCRGFGAGFACQATSTGGALCRQGTQCNPKNPGTPTCSGSLLTVCNGGRTVQVDCKKLGFSGCSGGICI